MMKWHVSLWAQNLYGAGVVYAKDFMTIDLTEMNGPHYIAEDKMLIG